MNGTAQALKVLEGPNNRLMLYEDRVVLQRKDQLSAAIPAVFGESRTLYLINVAAVRIYASRFQNMAKMEIISHEGNALAITFHEEDCKRAREIKDLVEQGLKQKTSD